jgi:hypothetical protein
VCTCVQIARVPAVDGISEQQTLKGVFLLTRESVCRHGIQASGQPVGVGGAWAERVFFFFFACVAQNRTE